MKKNFKKIMSLVLTVLMLVGTFSALIPMTASAEGETMELQLNADNYINGYNYRFETNDTTGKYARIEDGKLKFFLKKGDIFYISNLTVKDLTSEFTFEGMTSDTNDMYIQIAHGVTGAANEKIIGYGFGGYNWKAGVWTRNGDYFNKDNVTQYAAGPEHDETVKGWGGTVSQGSGKDALWAKGEVLSIRTGYSSWGGVCPKTHFYEGVASLDGVADSDMYMRVYPYAGYADGKSFGIIVNETNGGEVSIDKITATNMNETASYVEDFVIEATPEVNYPTFDLVPNADNWINGQTYRFETNNSDSYARIENGKLVLKMSAGDLFWIPTLTVKDTSSAFTFDSMTTDKSGTRVMVVTHIKTGENMYGTGIANNGNGVWVINRQKWNGNGITLANYDKHFASITDWGGTERPVDGNWQSSETLNVRGTFTSWSGVVPKIYFKEGSSAEYNMRTYPSIGTSDCVGGAFGLSLVDGSATMTIDKITATGMNETASYSESFNSLATRIVPNTDNWINGQNYRLETTNADSSAMIKDGKLVLNIKAGDLFWIPSLTVKDNTSSFTYENISTSTNGARLAVMNHVTTSDKMYGTAICNSSQWIGYRYSWNGNSIAAANYDVNYMSTNWGGTTTPNGSTHDGNWTTSEALSVRTSYSGSTLVPRTYFYEGKTSLDTVTSSNNDVNFLWYPQLSTCAGTSFGISIASGSATFTIDKITATNMNEVASYTETFNEIDTTKPACISDAKVNLSLDGVIGLNFTFNASAITPAGATVVATMNGETVATADVVEGANTVTVPVTAKEMIDDVNFAIKVNGELFEEQSYTTSVAKYAAELKKDAEWAELMDAMLKYGAAAQLLLDYKADNLAADVNGVTYDFSDYEAIDYEGNTSLLKGLYVNLTLEADTTLKLYFKPADDVTLNVTVNGEAATVVDNGDGYYVVAIDGIAADKLLEDVFVVVNGDLTFYISALDWAKVASESDDANVAIVANALAAYGDAASKKA